MFAFIHSILQLRTANPRRLNAGKRGTTRSAGPDPDFRGNWYHSRFILNLGLFELMDRNRKWVDSSRAGTGYRRGPQLWEYHLTWR